MFNLAIRNISQNKTASSFLSETDKLAQFIPVPIFSILGFISNFINIAVFLHSEMKDVSFKYMLAISISNLFYSIFMSLIMILFCTDCILNKTYEMAYLRIFIYYYFSYVFYIFSILCEFFVSVHRLLILKKVKIASKIPHRCVLLGTFLFSLIFQLSEFFSYDLIETDYFLNNTKANSIFTLDYSYFGASRVGVLLPICQASFRIIISTLLLPLINVWIGYEFNKIIKSKIKLSNNQNSTSGNEI